MRDLVVHTPSGVILDLADPDYGYTDGTGTDLIRTLYRECKRGILVCEKHGGALYLQKRHGLLWGVHFDGGQSHRLSSGTSDEHKRQAEYFARAAKAEAGYDSATEVQLTGVRPDLVIYGPTAVAVEVQRSGLTPDRAVERTRRAMANGMSTSVWSTDRQNGNPKWFNRVPSVGFNNLPWDVLPPRRAATATGLREITDARCDYSNFPVRCPSQARGRCGKRHPKHEPWGGLTMDDVAARVPAGLIVPLRFPRLKGGSDVLLVSPDSLRLYEELTGRASELLFNPLAEPSKKWVGEDERVECLVIMDDRCIWCGNELLLKRPGRDTCEPCRLNGRGVGQLPVPFWEMI